MHLIPTPPSHIVSLLLLLLWCLPDLREAVKMIEDGNLCSPCRFVLMAALFLSLCFARTAAAEKETVEERMERRQAALKQMNREGGWRRDVKAPEQRTEEERKAEEARVESVRQDMRRRADSRGMVYDDGNLNWPVFVAGWAIARGEQIGDSDLMAKGKRNLELLAFRLHALGPGTPGEMNSPWYQARSQCKLATIIVDVKDPASRLLAEVLLERLYLDMVSRYHAPSQRLGGPWSRAYSGGDVGALHGATFPLMMQADQRPFIGDRALGEVGCFDLANAVMRWVRWYHPLPDYLVWIAEKKSYPYLVQTQTKCCDYGRGGAEGRDLYPGSRGTSTTYQTSHYVLGSCSRPYVDDGHGKMCIAHWKRADKIESMSDFRTLYTHYTFNERKPIHANIHYNWEQHELKVFGQKGTERKVGIRFWHNDGRAMVTQHKGKAVVLYHPKTFEARHVSSMKLDVALPLYAPLDGLYINERRVGHLPAEANYDDLIFIEDADVYVAIRPLKPVHMGGPRKVYLSVVEPQLVQEFVAEGGPRLKGHLLVSIYNYYDPTGELKELARAGDPTFRLNYNGLILELATRDEYPTLEDFRRHIRSASVTDRMMMAPGQKEGDRPEVRRVSYTSGGDTIVAAYRLTTETYLERTINGRPVEPDMFESPLAAQSRSGQITLGNTTCRFDRGVPLTLIALEEPAKYAVINVLNVPTRVELKTPQGRVSTSVFRRGILRFYPDRKETLVEVRAAQLLAPLHVETDTRRVTVTLNGKPMQD